eukprot:140205-Prorocentrum_minimum.AAC.1
MLVATRSEATQVRPATQPIGRGPRAPPLAARPSSLAPRPRTRPRTFFRLPETERARSFLPAGCLPLRGWTETRVSAVSHSGGAPRRRRGSRPHQAQ